MPDAQIGTRSYFAELTGNELFLIHLSHSEHCVWINDVHTEHMESHQSVCTNLEKRFTILH